MSKELAERVAILEDKASKTALDTAVVKEFRQDIRTMSSKNEASHGKLFDELERVSETITKVSTLLFGDGKTVGMCETVRKNEERIDKMLAFLSKIGTAACISTVLAICGFIFVKVGLK